MPSTDNQTGRRSPLALLVHPLVLSAVAITAVNDHFLKGSEWLPGVVTGKLSDVAGLFFFPVLLAMLLYLAARGVERVLPVALRRARNWNPRVFADLSAVATAGVFSTMNLSTQLNHLFEPTWGVVTLDPTDLFCLPAVVAARWFVVANWPSPAEAPTKEAPRTPRTPKWVCWSALAFAVTVSLATSPPRTTEFARFPSWQIESPGVECLDDVGVRGWFAKSGKEGAGLVLQFETSNDEPRTVDIRSAQFRLRRTVNEGVDRGDPVDAAELPSTTVEDQSSVYLPFVFDNEEAWNRDFHHATVAVEVAVDGRTTNLHYLAFHPPAPWVERYERYDEWSRQTGVEGGWGIWGEAPDEPELERTGPQVDQPGQYFVRDPERPEVIRLRIDRESDRSCAGDSNG